MKKIKNNKVLGGLLVACFICASTLNANANTLGDNSGYKLTEKATASSNTITILNYDRSLNTLNPKYYDLNLTTTTYGSGSNSKKINVTLPNNKTTTITAKYGTGDYVGKSSTTAGGAINITNRTHNGTITGNFINNTSTANAAAIYVYGDSSITGGINANFIGNTVNSTSIVTGAAITLDSADGAGGVTGNIGNISGVFISNSVSGDLGASGGAIQIAKGYENGNTNIIANFINNSVNSANANACGGAIDFFGDLKNITGDFIGNHANSNATYKDGYLRDAYGGAIFSYGGSVGNITGDFIGNYAKTTNTTNATGGAISFRFLVERTGTISGDFIQNYVDSNVDAFGGFLYNYGGNIGDIIGNFNGNYAKGKKNAYGGAIANSFYGNSYKNKINSVQGTFAGNYTTAASNSFGGAIYNTGTLDIKNASFYSNHADSTGSKAKGGAIYNTGNNAKLTITADNYNAEFIGNYVNNNGTKTNNAIYTDAAITMKAINNGSILLDDKITGTSGYGLTFTGDNTGRIFLNNTIGSPKITANKVTLDMQNNNYQAYSWNTLSADKTVKFEIDSDLKAGKTDTITISTAPSTQSYVNISDLGWNDNLTFTDSDLNKKLQILTTPSNKIQLSLDNAITSKQYKYGQRIHNYDNIVTTVNSNETFYDISDTYDLYGNVKLAQTSTTNDSITFVANSSLDTLVDTVKTAHTDTLATLNRYVTSDDKVFNIVTGSYNVKENLGETIGNITINNNTLNLGGFSGFELANSSTLNLNNIKLTGNQTVVSVSNPNAIINLNNAFLEGNIDANNSFAMNFAGDKNTINGTVQNANATLNSGELVFNTDSFANATLNAVNGSISLANSKLNTYNFNVLNASETKFSIDIDLSNEKSDVLNVGTNSTGNVLIDSINFFNPDTPTKEFIVKVINGDSNNIGLQLSNSVQDNEYKIGTTTKVTNNINSNVTFGETFKEYTTNGDLYGKLEVATSDAKNDSIKLTYNKTIWGETIEKELKDSLAGLGKLDTTEDKNFNFTSKDDTYIATENFGEVSEGTLNINGVNGSTIDGNNKDLFELNNKTEININDVVINNANSVITGTNPDVIINIKDSEISGNKNGITTAGDINIEGNTTIDNNGNGIIVTDNNSQINIDGSKGNIVILDKITGTSESDLNIENGNIILGNIIKDLDVNIDNATINLPTENIFQGVDATIGNSNFNSVNNNTSSIIFDSLTLTGNINMAVDVDLANSQMDNIFSSTFNGNDFTINVSHMNMLSDTENVITKIAFANDAIKNNVTTSVKEVSYSPIWSYLVEYEKDTGYFTFTKGNGATPGSYNSFNPAITVGPVAAQMGGYLTILNSYEEAFRNMDMYMLMTKEQRQAIKYANKYASSNYNLAFNEINTPYTETSGWFRPFTTFETVGLKNGPKVNNVSYGSYAGLESNMYELGNGWDGIYSIYAGYTGSHQTYQGNSIYQNGGIFGIVGMAYKDNFFTGLTVNAGANTGEASTMYGSDDFTMFMTGVASKSGYNYEFNDGKFIIQPNFIMSYSMVNTYDFTNAAGVKINSDPLHALQLEPGIKFIGNLQNGWQPYAGVSVIWTIMDKTHFNANDVALPEMSVKPYAKYGVGVRKTWGEKLTGFFQAFVTSGGRNGVGLQTGVRYRLGNDEPKKSNSTGEKKYIKPKTKIQ